MVGGWRVAWLWLGVAGCTADLWHGLDEQQANEVLAALERSEIDADKVAEGPGTFKVAVRRGELGRSMAVLEQRGLPRALAKGTAETFANSGLIPSPAAERARLQASLAADLQRTLSVLPGVATARVHIALPDEDPLDTPAPARHPTASVLLRRRSALTLSAEELRRFVANGVSGLAPADVSLVVVEAGQEPTVPETVRVGPLRVSRGSRRLAVGLLSGALLAVLGSAAVVGTTALRRQRRD